MWSLLSNSKLSSLHQLLPRLNPTAEMVQQTYGEPNPTMAETGSLINKGLPRPDILQKNPQNLFLLAEARCGQTALNDAIFEVKQALSSLKRAHRNSWPNGMIQDFIVRLSNKLDASEATLSRCQSKLNALVSIHPAFCPLHLQWKIH